MIHRIIFVTMVSLFGASLYGQEISQKNVPSVLINKFRKAFPKAKDVEWVKKGEDFIVEFEEKGVEKHKIWYDKTLHVYKHVETIVIKQIPEKIKNTLVKEFPKFKWEEIKKVTLDGVLHYEVEVEKGNEEWVVIMDEEGCILSKVPD